MVFLLSWLSRFLNNRAVRLAALLYCSHFTPLCIKLFLFLGKSTKKLLLPELLFQV